MQTVIFALGEPLRLSVGRLTPEEKGDLLMKEELQLDEGVLGRSVFDINDFLEEYGLDFETMDLDVPGKFGFDVERVKSQAVVMPFRRPEQGDFLVFRRYVVSSEEFVGKFVFPFEAKDLKEENLAPLVFDFGDFCGAPSLMVGFFYLHEEPEKLREFLARELRRVPPEVQPRFLRELDAALTSGRLPHGPELPGKITFHDLVPLEADFEERYEAQVMEAQPGEVECYSLQVIAERPVLETE
ncbi:MAG: hypothetical protein GXO17_01205 [Thermodesulfobacteria bacterium]|nr:hypothetical protein [Thermodesulfobacteriota bacterium]